MVLHLCRGGKGGAKESSGLQEEAQGHLHHPGHWSATLMAYFKAPWPNSAFLLMASFRRSIRNEHSSKNFGM